MASIILCNAGENVLLLSGRYCYLFARPQSIWNVWMNCYRVGSMQEFSLMQRNAHFPTKTSKLLGHFSKDEIQSDNGIIASVLNFFMSRESRHLGSCLGMASDFRWFVSKSLAIASSLNKHLQSGTPWGWAKQWEAVFETVKDDLMLMVIDYNQRKMDEDEEGNGHSGWCSFADEKVYCINSLHPHDCPRT